MQNSIIVGDFDWLRNDFVSPIDIAGITYPTVEHAYQAAKTNDRSIKEKIASASTVREARKIGKNIEINEFVWYCSKFDVMNVLIFEKFISNQKLADKLIETGIVEIVMQSNDGFWGTGEDECGYNNLGVILEKVRTHLQILNGYNIEDEEVATEPQTLLEALENPDDILKELLQKLYDATQRSLDNNFGSLELSLVFNDLKDLLKDTNPSCEEEDSYFMD